MDEEVYKTISLKDLYARTGIQKAIFNTVYQLMAVKKKHPEYLEQAETLLHVPDYFHFLLTGEKTWPCENDGATDESPRTKSFRYARNQPVTDVGVVYQFELEPGETYNLELGFYVPSSWTNASNPRTMKLVLNDTDVVNDTYRQQ